MNPWIEEQRQRWHLYAGIALAVVGAVTGLLLMTGVLRGDDDPGRTETPLPSPGPTVTDPGPTDPSGPTTPSDPAGDQLLEVVSWGQASGQLAVEVRNQSARVIEQMRVRITAVDSSGAVVLSTTGTARDLCCTVVGLPPGRSFGLFATVRAPSSDVAAVQVEPVETELGGARPVARVVAQDPRLERLADDTVAVVDLVRRHGSPRAVAVQAFLTDGNGRVGQVISGRFCLNMRAREVRLHLFHAVPGILDLDRVVAYALPPGVDPQLPWDCR